MIVNPNLGTEQGTTDPPLFPQRTKLDTIMHVKI